MKEYPDYKDSGFDRLGKVPSHWGVYNLKRMTNFNYGNSLSKEIRIDGKIPVYGSNGVVGYHDESITKSPCIIVGRKGSFGKVNYSEIECFPIDTTYFIDETATKNNLRWLYYLLLSLRLDAFSKDSAVPGLSREDAYEKRAVLPPLPEQQAIADFLDRKTAQIDTLIEKKQHQIDLLQEQRDVMTQNAMRSSEAKSIKLGDVADWIKRPINRQDEELYERIGLYNRGRGIFHKPIAKGVDLGDSDFFEIKDGDFVISGQFAWEGAVALARKEEDGCFASHRYYSLRGKPDYAETAYLFSFFTTQLGDNLLNHHSRGAAGRNRPLNINTLLREKIPVPPLSMQKPITDLIEKTVVLKKNTQKLVDFLQEYRTALISEAVTGKIDVRTAETVHE